MDKYTLGEVAYKNGYEKGFQDGVKSLEAKIDKFKTENAIIIKQAFAENRTTATAIKAEFEQQRRTVEYIKRLEAEIEKLQQNLKEAHIDIKEHMVKIERFKSAFKQLKEYSNCYGGNGNCENCFGDWDCGGSCHDYAKMLISALFNELIEGKEDER